MVVALVPPGPAAAAEAGTDASRERLVGEFSAVINGPHAPEDICLTLYRNGEVIHEVAGDRSFVPASLMKIATAAVALELMGPDATYTTQVAVRADALAGVSDGVLNGDLYLIGGGDPTLATRGYISSLSRLRPFTDVEVLADAVMASLRSAGVTVVNGSVVGDESRYGDGERDYTSQYLSDVRIWKTSFVTTNLVGPLSALMINDGYHPVGGSRRGHVRPFNPAVGAARLFDDLLEARGLVIRSRPGAATAPEPQVRESLGVIESVPLSQIVARMLTHSDNTTSEMVLKEIGHRTSGSARAQAAAGAQAVLGDLLGEHAAQVRMVDGSGLSIHNQMSCAAVARLLIDAGLDSPLVRGLAVAGRSGTLRNCRPRTVAAANDVRAKSGTLNDTDALAGVTVAPNGDVVTFAMISYEHLIIVSGTCNRLRLGLIDAAAGYTYGPERGTDEPDGGTDEPDGGTATFVDLPDGVHGPAVRELVAAGVALACDDTGTRFCPREPITRSEVAWYLAELLDLPPAPSLDRFDDVDPDSAYAAPIAALAQAGITRGCDPSGTRFCGDQDLTRAQAASFLSRAFDLPPAPVLGWFTDVEPGSSHEAAIAALAYAQITRGCDASGPHYCPQRILSRAEFATFLSRALKR